MKNPLYKRLPRELKSEMGKYIALFLFLVVTIGFCSGFLVADGSTKRAYDESFEKYSIEDGHFVLSEKMSSKTAQALEDEDIKISELFYKDKEFSDEHVIRIYKNRGDVNKVDLMEGKLPGSENEIAIDRLYAENNDIAIGDKLAIDEKEYEVCGFTAFSDYSALFKNNTDMMFDANKFTVALVTEESFEDMSEAGLRYCYAWVNDDKGLSEEEQQEKADDIRKTISQTALLTDFVARNDNQAIMFTGDDMGGDKIMVQWLLYIVIVVLAFAFAVTTINTIEQEAAVIGTLRASGYTKNELLLHYLALPVLVTFTAAVLGNIIGYTLMKGVIASLYYHSYSLPTYVTVWNGEAFVLTTLIPCLIILAINFLVIRSSLSLSPLKFLRHDLKHREKKRAFRLTKGSFMTRFRLRIISQNKGAYITMFAGIFFASILLMFGMMFSPLLDSFKEEVESSAISEYQYILKAPVETDTEGAEKYSVKSLENESEEDITVYGIKEDSAYFADFSADGGAIISDGLMEKYGIEIGDKITLHEKFEDKEYEFRVTGSYHYPATMSIFLEREQFNRVFGKDEDYFTGYFSNRRIEDIDDDYIASTITEHDLTIIANQLEDSMGMVFPMFGGFAIIIYLLMIYLLAKLVIDKNARYVSMIKLLGYTDGEIDRLYNRATSIVVAFSLVVAIPLCSFVIRKIYYVMMLEYSGWLTYYIAPWIYPAMIGIGGGCYLLVHIIEMKKIKKISAAHALKDME